MKQLESVVPHIPLNDMQATIDFMVGTLGFESLHRTELYSEVRSGHQLIGVLAAQGKPNEQSIYLRVKDIDIFWSELKIS